jgi:hypothetical protein
MQKREIRAQQGEVAAERRMFVSVIFLDLRGWAQAVSESALILHPH